MVEFFTYEDEAWYRLDTGETKCLEESATEIVKEMYSIIQNQYTEAFNALAKRYEKLSYNLRLYQFKIVERFIKCNLGNIDISKYDLENFTINLERVACPMRGECQFEGIICNPKFNSHLTEQEERVARLLVKGEKTDQIASMLFISPSTAHNHIRNIYKKLNIHSIVELCNISKQWEDQ